MCMAVEVAVGGAMATVKAYKVALVVVPVAVPVKARMARPARVALSLQFMHESTVSIVNDPLCAAPILLQAASLLSFVNLGSLPPR